MNHSINVSVVIPAYNEADSIQKCLESLLNQTVRPFEVLIVNNLSTDDTVAVAKRCMREYGDKLNIRLLHQSKKQGITATRNHGMRYAKGEVIGRIDADSTLEPGWIAAVQQTFADESVAAATGPVIYHDMPARNTGFRADNQIRTTLDKLAKKHRFLFGSNMAVRASVWREVVGSFCLDDEDEMHEDIDAALHLHEQNYTIVYVCDMVGGQSARRLENTPSEFYRYVMRFEKTYKNHGIVSASARIPIFIYLATYFPLKFVRFTYDGDTQKFTFDKFKELISRRRGDDIDHDIII